ncbi:MAG: hypothetical protein ACREX4_19455 [Gammaproteobacteria bacterium]
MGAIPSFFAKVATLRRRGNCTDPRWGKCTASVVIHQPQLPVARAHKQNALGKPPPPTSGTEIATQESED